MSQDLNYNCVMSTFLLEQNNKNKLNEVISLLKNQGIEVISMSKRYLSAEEAFLLRSRIIDAKETSLKQQMGLGFKKITENN